MLSFVDAISLKFYAVKLHIFNKHVDILNEIWIFLWFLSKTRQSATTTESNSIISKHFITIDKKLNENVEKEEAPTSSINQITIEDSNIDKTKGKSSPVKPKATRAKRTKLDAFVFKAPQAAATERQTVIKTHNDDDFDVPEKKTKKAPPANSINNTPAKAKKPSRRKKQTTIKTAFMRNEQLFAEIAAQHCAADNFDGDDIQLAIAISKSEAESKGVDVIGDDALVAHGVDAQNDVEKAEEIRKKLEKYGFRTAEQKGEISVMLLNSIQVRPRLLVEVGPIEGGLWKQIYLLYLCIK